MKRFEKLSRLAVVKVGAGFLLFMLICTALGGQVDRLMTTMVTFGATAQERVLSEECIREIDGQTVVFTARLQRGNTGVYVVWPKRVEVIEWVGGQVRIDPVDYIDGLIVRYATKPLTPGQRVRVQP